MIILLNNQNRILILQLIREVPNVIIHKHGLQRNRPLSIVYLNDSKMDDYLTRKIRSTFLCFLILSFHLGALNAQDKYNLEFRNMMNFKWFTNVNPVSRIDSSVLIHNKYPMVFEQEKDNLYSFMGQVLLTPDIRQTFLLPDSLKNACVKISINNKCLNMEKLLLRVIGLNKHQEVALADSIDINNAEQWTVKSLRLNLSDTKFLMVGIDGYSPAFQQKPSKLYLDRITITLNDQDIGEIGGIDNLAPHASTRFYPELIVADSITSKFIQQTLLPNKRIIALGETVHGSVEIAECAFNIIKENILNNNCRCVMLEEDMSMLLKMNLFVSEKLPEESLEDIEKDMSVTLINKNALLHFLSWLRKYNHDTSTGKVRLWGFESQWTYTRNALFDYFYAFYDTKHKSIFYPMLEYLKSLNFKQALTLATAQATTLENLMGKDEYQMFLYILGFQNQERSESYNPIDSHLFLKKRDYYMYRNVDYFLQHHLQANEKVLIYTHYGHAQKKEELRTIFPVLLPLGYYLAQKYKDDYGVIGITIGEGEITSRSNEARGEFTTYKLTPASTSLLEKLFINANKEYIYFPTQCLPDDIYMIRYIGNRVRTETQEIYNAVKECADGFVFIRHSHGFTNHENGKFDPDYLYKYIHRKKILQQIRL